MATGLTIGQRHIYTISGYCRTTRQKFNFCICNLVEKCILKHYDDSDRFDFRDHLKQIKYVNNVFKLVKHPQNTSPISIFGELNVHSDTNYQWIFKFSSEYRYELGVYNSNNKKKIKSSIINGEFERCVSCEGKYFDNSIIQRKIFIDFHSPLVNEFEWKFGMEIDGDGYSEIVVPKDDDAKYNLVIHIIPYKNSKTKDILEFVSSKYISVEKCYKSTLDLSKLVRIRQLR